MTAMKTLIEAAEAVMKSDGRDLQAFAQLRRAIASAKATEPPAIETREKEAK